MSSIARRECLSLAAATLAAGPTLARQPGHEHHGGVHEQLNQPGRISRPALAATQNVFDPPAPKTPWPGRWSAT